MTNLEGLELHGAELTDAGLCHLSQLKNLKVLYLRETHVTGERKGDKSNYRQAGAVTVDSKDAANSTHCPGGTVFHVLNRANARARIFAKEADYAAFERVMKETIARKPMRILGYLIMPNHWHLVLWPERTATWRRSCSGSRSHMCGAGTCTARPWAAGIS